MRRGKREKLLRPKLVAASVAACFALSAGPLHANPSSPTVVSGGVGFSGLGTSALTVTNQAGGNAIINWNGFSIGANELTRFQQFANLAVLNRVTGSQLSSILGSLQSDGRVFLINPNGIVFGSSARIDVAGLVASSLNLSDQDFLADRLRFTEVPGAGTVANNGVIETSTGGRVYLVAPAVENNGLIRSPQGAIVLAAGKEVELVDAASPFVTVKVAAAERAVNVGNLVADSGQVGMFGALVRNSGLVEAGGAVAGPGGEIRLVAVRELTLDSASVVAANGTSGGKVLLQAEGGTNLVDGTVEARGSSGKGGEVSALGVRVGVVGHGVIDASGDTAGGTVRVGGDYQGGNTAVQNAESTSIGPDGVIRADAMTAGNGGRVIAWADGDTRFYGSISAKGGSEGGNGGFVETSAKGALEAFGGVNTSAANGQGGTWLLDPANINIVANNGAPNDDDQVATFGLLPFDWNPPATSAVGVNSILAAMQGANDVELQATNNIKLLTNLDSSAYDKALTLTAGNDIELSSNDITTGGDLTLSAGNEITGGHNLLQSVNGAVTLSGAANLSGSLDITAQTSIGTGSITTDSYNSRVNLTANGGSIVTGSIKTSPAGDGDATVVLSAGGGSVTVNGGIEAGVEAIAAGSFFGATDVSISATGDIATGDITTGESFSRAIYLAADGNITTGSLTARALSAGVAAGDVFVRTDSGQIVINGNIDTRGANGIDLGQSPYYAGTAAGDVSLSRGASDGFAGTAITVNGSILTSGGTAASVAGESFGNQTGGAGGDVEMGDLCGGFCGPLSGSVVVTGGINTNGGSGGDTGEATSSTAGDWAGDVHVAATGSIGIGSILARGGNAGSGSDGAYGGNYGDWGGAVLLSGGGAVNVSSIDVSGGAGGVAGGSVSGDSYGGAGGHAGGLSIQSASTTIGSLVARGGSGAAAGTSGGYSYADGGDGGNGGYVTISTTSGPLALGPVDLSGGNGGAGGVATVSAAGGWGGGGGYFRATSAGDASLASIATGAIVARGGNGGAGGAISDPGGDSSGGSGGTGGTVWLDTSTYQQQALVGQDIALVEQQAVLVKSPSFSFIAGPITTGSIDVSGGHGGNSGAVGSSSTGGGSGGSGGEATLVGSTIGVAGAMLARGGNGGQVVNASLAAGGAPVGGNGGGGGVVWVYGLDTVQVNVGGTLGTLAIDVSGGAGGAGNPAASPAGDGGMGGDGGSANVVGTPDMTLFGSINAAGGAGGAGGAGNASFPGGTGGDGGSAGSIFLDASSITESNSGDGKIFVLAGTQFNVQGGFGGSGGAGGGVPGTSGASNTFIQGSDYFGTLVILDPLSVPEINAGFQQVVKSGADATVFIGSETSEEDEDKAQKEFGSCKG